MASRWDWDNDIAAHKDIEKNRHKYTFTERVLDWIIDFLERRMK